MLNTRCSAILTVVTGAAVPLTYRDLLTNTTPSVPMALAKTDLRFHLFDSCVVHTTSMLAKMVAQPGLLYVDEPAFAAAAIGKKYVTWCTFDDDAQYGVALPVVSTNAVPTESTLHSALLKEYATPITVSLAAKTTFQLAVIPHERVYAVHVAVPPHPQLQRGAVVVAVDGVSIAGRSETEALALLNKAATLQVKLSFHSFYDAYARPVSAVHMHARSSPRSTMRRTARARGYRRGCSGPHSCLCFSSLFLSCMIFTSRPWLL